MIYKTYISKYDKLKVGELYYIQNNMMYKSRIKIILILKKYNINQEEYLQYMGADFKIKEIPEEEMMYYNFFEITSGVIKNNNSDNIL